MDKLIDKPVITPTGEREAWNGPKHARGRRGLGVDITANDILKESAASSVENPYGKGRIAEPGDYEGARKKAHFGGSRLLGDIAPYIESGDFDGGLKATEAAIAGRLIPYKWVSPDQLTDLTHLDTIAAGETRSTMILPDDFRRLPNEMQLWELLHRNMELILKRRGASMTPTMMTDIYDMAFAYARTLRLGVKDKGAAKAPVEVSADVIEDWALSKLKIARRI